MPDVEGVSGDVRLSLQPPVALFLPRITVNVVAVLLPEPTTPETLLELDDLVHHVDGGDHAGVAALVARAADVAVDEPAVGPCVRYGANAALSQTAAVVGSVCAGPPGGECGGDPAAALLMLVVAVPVSGLAPGLPVPAPVLAAARAPLITLTTVAVAANKVEGLAWLKILGLLPTGIAPAMWWLPDIAQWPLRVFPHCWTVDILWQPGPLGLLVGIILTAIVTALLTRRTLRRFDSH